VKFNIPRLSISGRLHRFTHEGLKMRTEATALAGDQVFAGACHVQRRFTLDPTPDFDLLD